MNELQVFSQLKNAHPDAIRGFIHALEETCMDCSDKIDVPITHHFAHKIYAREMHLKAGSLVVGKIHKFENLSVLSQGEASVLSVEGLYRLKAPHTFTAVAGTKRVIFAHTDLIWTTFHATEERDLERIEEEIIAKNYADVPQLGSKLNHFLEGNK